MSVKSWLSDNSVKILGGLLSAFVAVLCAGVLFAWDVSAEVTDARNDIESLKETQMEMKDVPSSIGIINNELKHMNRQLDKIDKKLDRKVK